MPPVPNTARPIWESTVGVPDRYGTAWVRAAKTDTDRNMAPRMEAMRTSVVRALRTWGGLNTVTALEMASIPVMAEPPLAKAFRNMKSDAPSNNPVSYTHLRAHETGRNLVCRLLLEKKKKKK